MVSSDGDLIQYYSLYAYTSTGNNTYSIMDISDIYNYKSYAETSTKSSDIDNDGIDEILINTGTLFYVMKFNNDLKRFIPIYYKSDINTVNQITYDFDANGINEIGLNTTDDTLFFYEKNIAFTGPATPLNIKGYSLDSNVNKLTFESVIGADQYRIYKSDTTENFILYDSTLSLEYYDSNVVNKNYYYYKVSAVDNQNQIRESQLSSYIRVYTHNKTKLLSAIYEGNGFLTIRFSERVASTIPNLSSFYISDVGNPKNVALRNNFEYFLTFEQRLANGEYSIRTAGLTDAYGSPVDSNVVQFTVSQIDSAKFYISKLNLIENLMLRVEFNLEADSVSAEDVNNYKFEPFAMNVKSARLDDVNKKIVYIELENNGVIGATGKNYILKAYNIYSSNGIKIVDGAGSSFGLIFNRDNLEEMYVYPNPYSISSNQDYITFANITRDASIDIYDLTGKFLINLRETNGNGGVEWNLQDKNGNSAISGIYIYRAVGKNSSGVEVEEKVGKFAIVK